MNYSVHTYNVYNPAAPKTMIAMSLEQWLIMVWWILRFDPFSGWPLKSELDKLVLDVGASTAEILHGYLLFRDGTAIEYTALA